MLPPVLADIMKFEGRYVAAPVNIHRVDWMWANPSVLAEVGVTEMPTTWEEFNAIAEQLQAAASLRSLTGASPGRTPRCLKPSF